MIDHNATDKYVASIAMIKDSATILAYLIDKKRKNIPITEEEQEIIREHTMWLKIFCADFNNDKD